MFENLLKILPQPLLVAVVLAACSYFGVYYWRSYSSFGDGVRDPTFQSLTVIIMAACLLFLINGRPTDHPKANCAVIVSRFFKDQDERCRSVFTSELGAKLDRALKRTRCVVEINEPIDSERAAKDAMVRYSAQAIVYGTTVSEFSGEVTLTPKVLLEKGPTPTIPPVAMKQLETAIEPLVSLFVGIAGSENVTNSSIVEKVAMLEQRINALATAIPRKESSPTPETSPAYNHKYAIIVGNSRYQSSEIPALRSPEQDARLLSELLGSRYGFKCSSLFNATRSEILEAVGSMSRTSMEDDLLVFYYSGHVILNENRQASLLASDSTPKQGTLPMIEVLSMLVSGKSKYMLSVLDACHAAAGISWTDLGKPSLAGRTLVCLSACGPNQLAFYTDSGSIFTRALAKVLAEAPANLPVSTDEIFAKVQATVTVDNGQQEPVALNLGKPLLLVPMTAER